MNTHKLFSAITFIFLSISILQAQPVIEWEHSLGGNDSELAYAIRQTSDGGFITVGVTFSNDVDVSGNHSSFFGDVWLVKLDENGEIQWQHCLGGTNDEYGYSLEITPDGGFIIAGSSGSSNGDVTTNNGSRDYWIVKTDDLGNIEWEKSYGGSFDDEAFSIALTSDSGFIVTGYSYSSNGDVTGHHGDNSYPDYWLLKLDNNGNLQWEKSLGGVSDDRAQRVINTNDGGYMVAGISYSDDGDVTNHHDFTFTSDAWIVKLDSVGNISWENSLGGSFYDGANAVVQKTNGNYVVAAYASSDDGDVSNAHGANDYWIVELNSLGDIVWEKTYGGFLDDVPTNISFTSSGDYFVAGYADSDNGVTGHHNESDYWPMKLDTNGNIIWEHAFGGSIVDRAFDGMQTSDGGYILAGASNSLNGDVSNNIAFNDWWIVKLESDCAIALAGFNYVMNGNEVTFIDSSVNAENYLWNFGDGVTDTSANPIHIYTVPGIYTACLTVTDSCSKDSICQTISIIATSNAEVMNNGNLTLSISPNPISAQASVQFSIQEKSDVSLQLADLSGKKIYSLLNATMNSGNHVLNFDAGSLPGGMYLLQFISNGKSVNKKLVIQR